MDWYARYRLRHFLNGTLTLAPVAAIPLAVLTGKLVRELAGHVDFELVGLGVDGARALLGAFVGATLSFFVFVFSILLLAVQLASAQLSPRVIGSILRDRPTKVVLGIFVFSNVYDIGAMARVDENVIELPVFVATIATGASLIAFLYLVDYMTRSLRPAAVISRIGSVGIEVIDQVYPLRLDAPAPVRTATASLGTPTRTLVHEGAAGVLAAFDTKGLLQLATDSGCTVELVPQVGDFVAHEEPLLRVYGTGDIDETRLRRSVAVEAERSFEQDPAFCFRVLVEIASKALSAAINDPATAVLALDQLHRLLRMASQRNLDTGDVCDCAGRLRLRYRTPDWEDFVSMATAEIRLFGGGSLQVARRLRAMLDEVLRQAPPQRRPALATELDLLRRWVERSFQDPEDRARASIGDLQGVGGSDVYGNAPAA